jgi:hypothetical protein
MRAMRATIAAGALCGFAMWAGLAQAAEPEPRLEGHWEGMIDVRPGEFEVDMTLDIQQAADGSLSGHLSYPNQGPKEYALDTVQLEGGSLLITSTDEQGTVSVFQGRSLDGGNILQGELTEGGKKAPFELHRTGKAARKPPAVQNLGSDGAELKALFNQDQEKVRLVMVLSPACGNCRMAARMLERHLLEQVQDPALGVYIVWERVSPADTQEIAAQASGLLADPRIHDFWSPEHFTSTAFHDAVGARRTLSWDIFLVFGKGKRWADAPPVPDTFMHNQKMNEELAKDRLLNVEKLAGEVKALLAASPVASAPADPAPTSESKPPA